MTVRGFLVILDQPPHQMATKWFKQGHFHSFYLQLFQPTSLLLIFFQCQISIFIHNYDICIVLTHPAALLKGLFLPKLLHGVCHILYKDVHLKYMLIMTMVMFIGTMMTCRYINIVISPNFKCKSLLRSQC